LLNHFSLLVDEQLLVAHDVDKQDVRNLKVRIGFELSRHQVKVLKIALP